MCKNLGKLAGFFVLLFLTVPASADAGTPYTLGLGLEFASGGYGTAATTRSIYAPFTVAVYPADRLDFSLEIPYIYQSSMGVTSSVFQGQGGQGMMGKSLAMMGGGGASSGMMGGSGDTGGGHGGLGDITLKAGYVVLEEKENMPRIRSSLFVKFPTADENEALGTGEYDGGIAVDASKWLNKWHVFSELGYSIQGKTDLLPLKNYVAYNAGVGYQVTRSFRPIILVKGATPPVEGFDPLLEGRIKFRYQPTDWFGLDAYLSKGLTDASPDYGSGINIYFDL